MSNNLNLLGRCKHRNVNPLVARATERIPYMTDKDYTTRYKVWLSHGNLVPLESLDDAGVSYLPISSNGFTKCRYVEAPVKSGKQGWDHHYGFKDFAQGYWNESYGIQIFTGKQSRWWTDVDIERAFLEHHPERAEQMVDELLAEVGDQEPLIAITKSGGVRFSCRTDGYEHPKKEQSHIGIYDDDKRCYKPLYVEVFGSKGLSRWDARYEILQGSILNPPEVSHESILGILSPYRDEFHVPPTKPVEHEPNTSKGEKPPKDPSEMNPISAIQYMPDAAQQIIDLANASYDGEMEVTMTPYDPDTQDHIEVSVIGQGIAVWMNIQDFVCLLNKANPPMSQWDNKWVSSQWDIYNKLNEWVAQFTGATGKLKEKKERTEGFNKVYDMFHGGD